jgi:hypothetical protein
MPNETLPPAEAENYWAESRRPLVSLVFILPMMLIYELGSWFYGIENGAEAWMRHLLDMMGFGQHLFLPFLIVAMLLGWNFLTRQPWRFSPGVLWPMAVEALLLAVCLRIILYVQGSLVLSLGETGKNAISYLGAGLYEELLFRLLLLSATVWLIRTVWPERTKSMMLAILASSLLFSAAHYSFINPAGEDFSAFSFLFRFVAGVFFAVLFIYRGFGITAGAHALYDILVGIL